MFMSIHFINALNGPIVTNDFRSIVGQDLHVTGMNQSQKRAGGCVHPDMYPVKF